MRTYKQTYGSGDNRRVSPAWWLDVRDHQDMRRRFAAFPDHAASEELGRMVDKLVALRSTGERPGIELMRQIEKLPERLRSKLADLNIIERRHLAGAQALDSLLDEFEASLGARGRTVKHIDHVVRRTRRLLIKECRFQSWSDIKARVVERVLGTLREGGMANKTSNHYLGAVKEFCRWTVEHGFATDDPLVVLKPVNARVDRRRERRPMDSDEIRRLLQATQDADTVRWGLSSRDRVALYRLAAETGLRASELRSLKVLSFTLEGEESFVALPATDTKNRQDASLPLRQDTAILMASVIHGRRRWDPAFSIAPGWRPAVMLKEDLKRAGIPYQDEEGRYRDFHSLRGSMISELLRSGANARVVQRLARHSSAEMTLGIYAQMRPDDERRAVESLPSLEIAGPDIEVRATGTEASAEKKHAISSAIPHAEQCSPVQSDEGAIATGAVASPVKGKRMVEAAGIEPASRKERQGRSTTSRQTTCDDQEPGEAKALCHSLGHHSPTDADLDAVVKAWASLPEHIRLAVLALIRAGA